MKNYVPYSQELANEILDAIADNKIGIRKLCAANPHWPDAKTIMQWKRQHEEFGKRYAHAKQDQIEQIIDEIIEIADFRELDTYIDKEGTERCDHEWIHRSRLRIDTRKWLAVKLLPKLYGDKIQVETSDPSADKDLIRAKEIAAKIQADNHGRSSEAEG